VLSQQAVTSAHVGKEIERASSKRRRIIALRTDSAALPRAFEYFLSESQWIDVGSGGIEAGAAKLVDAIRSHLTPGTSSLPAKTLAVDRKVAPSQWRWVAIASAAVVAMAFAYFVASRFLLPRHAPAEQPTITAAPPTAAIIDKSIAVLPFTDMSEKHDQEYMSDGIAEELLNLLAQAPGLKVIARTSSFAFKGRAVDIAEIAKKLNVAHVLEGSVRKSGSKIRITAQLIRTADSTHLWSETFDRPLKDIFAVQDEIAGAIAQALQIQLAGGELSHRKGGTQSLEAYQLYLRALGPSNQNTGPSLDVAGAYLEQAVKIDPGFGLAWSQLAWVFSIKADNGFTSATEGYGRARQLAQHALQVSPDLAEAHGILEAAYLVLDHNWEAAEQEGQAALAIDRSNWGALNSAGRLARALGRWDEAERQFQLELVRDPLNTYGIWNLGLTYYVAGRFADSERVFRQLLKLQPDFAWVRRGLAKTLLAQGKPEEALAEVQQEVDEGERLKVLPVLLQAVGRQADADIALQAQTALWGDRRASVVAMTYAYRGDHDHALEWLERAYQQKDIGLPIIVGEPLLKNLADDPRYKAFLRKMNLPE